MKLFSLKNFILSLNEVPKAHHFCFLLLIQRSAVQQKSNKATLPNSKSFFCCKTRVVRKSLCLLLHNNFFVFNISDNLWKSSHNLWTLPNHNSRSLEGLDFRACYSASAQSSTAPFWKPNVLGDLQESVYFEMTDESLRVEVVIASLLEHNLNKKLSYFRSFNSTPVFPNLFHPRTISRFYAVLAYHLHKLRALKAVKKFPHLLWRHNHVFYLCEV